MGKIFVVIVNYKSSERVARLVERLRGLPVIVIDNGLDGPNSPRLRGVKKVTVVDNERNLGFAGGVNVGIRRALAKEANRVLLVNPDVEITEKDVARLEKSMADIVSPVLKFKRQGRWVFDLGGRVNWVLGRTTHRETTRLPDYWTAGEIDYISGACMMIKTEVFWKVGFFDERFFMYFEDADFCLRARQAGFQVAVEPGVIVKHDISEHRLTHDRFKMWQSLRSNWVFAWKWVPWYFKPVAFVYLVSLSLRVLR